MEPYSDVTVYGVLALVCTQANVGVRVLVNVHPFGKVSDGVIDGPLVIDGYGVREGVIGVFTNRVMVGDGRVGLGVAPGNVFV
jgi:hypothetical protein